MREEDEEEDLRPHKHQKLDTGANSSLNTRHQSRKPPIASNQLSLPLLQEPISAEKFIPQHCSTQSENDRLSSFSDDRRSIKDQQLTELYAWKMKSDALIDRLVSEVLDLKNRNYVLLRRHQDIAAHYEEDISTLKNEVQTALRYIDETSSNNVEQYEGDGSAVPFSSTCASNTTTEVLSAAPAIEKKPNQPSVAMESEFTFKDLLQKHLYEQNFYLDVLSDDGQKVVEMASMTAYGSKTRYKNYYSRPQQQLGSLRCGLKGALTDNIDFVVDFPDGRLSGTSRAYCESLLARRLHINDREKRYQSKILARALYALFRGQVNYSTKFQWKVYPMNAVAFTIQLLEHCLKNIKNLSTPRKGGKTAHIEIMEGLVAYKQCHPDDFELAMCLLFDIGTESEAVFRKKVPQTP
ncbi:hypothetical protein SeLEV6574_g06765 [Synchytrium endobioticum]|uniref:Uncharacterized protein n=1 Tax=Synchytrium endobioticum TaxID=286115 RepID=A0A507CMT1_9FUNG|nr:hypothetical protein SeLEV6574_g06765 [Synchytrium endobioticum]